MPERVLSSISYLFAHDLKLLSISSSINFQNNSDERYQWCVKNGLIFHTDKTKLICNTPYVYFLNSLVLECVLSIKDLVLLAKPNFSWTEH